MGNERIVALKLITDKLQFLSETRTHSLQFDNEYVVQIIQIFPSTMKDIETLPDHIDIDTSHPLTKQDAERLYCIVFPYATRNLYLALKQERYVDDNFNTVRDIFMRIMICVKHIHSKGVIHGHIRPLNIMRENSRWKLVDLSAISEIGKALVGWKSSTAFIPPETVRIDERTGVIKINAVQAHPSFDIWSMGCILYQLCHPGRSHKDS
jgi:serine/threonine protein kinase